MELKAYQAYKNPELEICFWRTSSGFEVAFILDDMIVAIEVKSSAKIHKNHLKGLKALKEENKIKHSILVCMEKQPRTLDSGIEILPWQIFLKKLWGGSVGV